MTEHYNNALDAIYYHREAAALDAVAVRGMLQFSTLPKAVRTMLESMLLRLEAGARGDLSQYRALATPITPHPRLTNGKQALREAGASETLTKYQWEERPWDAISGKHQAVST